ncbi:hypothetical protein [Paragemmobacter aquarius]|uniref:hypothetical protein n=1 Tax=Paragemmobacter aquarius TaxID=2169400 RepID=UPI00131F149A|nr:hypothetical protein [Gemmobacter aquarius]
MTLHDAEEVHQLGDAVWMETTAESISRALLLDRKVSKLRRNPFFEQARLDASGCFDPFIDT